ncbi:hypothetical protein PHLCEN_2v823 [Hermanssonia centrifuga]|uniref:Folylpolyglutamate synthase n=1 Tax=Hermanssonia centrifuga TaxID=98765 RepID=A0A2R6S500_9APHY|nr:hypothetical protein PHLCEN_2v823 [Hermanssonia centrifuga]
MNTATTVSNLRFLSGRLHLPFASIRVTAIARTMTTIRSYGDAVEQLNSLQTNAATLEAVRASGGKSSDLAIPEMLEYLGRIGYAAEDLNKLNVVHITGTKGKGSTSAFTDAIIRQAKPGWKVGLYTSPHLVAVRERIRINGTPLSEEDFARYFFEVWDKLEKNDVRANPNTSPKPAYFRFITLVAYHAFLSLKVDATILEVGVGGTYDSTNIVPEPVVTGISALGIDHVTVLGRTLKEIAWQKGGIYKPGVPALTVDQPAEGMNMLKERATEKGASEFVIISKTPGLREIRLGLSGAHQYQNADLAIHLSRKFLQAQGGLEPKDSLTEYEINGLQSAKWPGRCQTVPDPNQPSITWFLDGAHTLESLDCCMQWFVGPHTALRNETSSRPKRILIFNCTSGRTGPAFLEAMLGKIAAQLKLHGDDEDAAKFFDDIIFCANVTYMSGNFKGDGTCADEDDTDLANKNTAEADLVQLKTQHELEAAWRSLVPSFGPDRVHVLPSIEHAVDLIRHQESPTIDVLVAGSLHLVGGVIEVAGLSEVAL